MVVEALASLTFVVPLSNGFHLLYLDSLVTAVGDKKWYLVMSSESKQVALTDHCIA